jgi:type II restriction enzyme
MSRKHELRKQRTGTVINLTSKNQESELGHALKTVEKRLVQQFGVQLKHDRQWTLKDVVERLQPAFPEVEFHYHFPTSAMRPDGGILSMLNAEGRAFPILITEVKNQGTNDLRLAEGKKKQSKGNAIERLGKNVIGFRTAMMGEQILPFLCFGYGCDFADDSSILDRVTTIAMFGPLNTVSVVNEGEGARFNRGSFFFQEKRWSADEMADVMVDVAGRSIHYYFARYSEDQFR